MAIPGPPESRFLYEKAYLGVPERLRKGANGVSKGVKIPPKGVKIGQNRVFWDFGDPDLITFGQNWSELAKSGDLKRGSEGQGTPFWAPSGALQTIIYQICIASSTVQAHFRYG